MDSIPIVVITGQVPSVAIGTDAFQEVDTVGITRSVTKHNELVMAAEDIPRIVKEAFHIASTGRPGPVLVDVPKDILTSEMEWHWPTSIDLPGYKPNTKGNGRQGWRGGSGARQTRTPWQCGRSGSAATRLSHCAASLGPTRGEPEPVRLPCRV